MENEKKVSYDLKALSDAESAANKMFKNFDDLMILQQTYNAAIKQLTLKFEILNEEFKINYKRNPIHHIESRLKSTKSIVKKLIKRGKEISIESARQNVNDIAGVRVVCCYIDDVYSVAEMLLRQSDVVLLKQKDYIQEPNYNGYRSLHLDIKIPVFLSEKTEYIPVEVQLRTVAMDFWASLEHDLHYKSNKNIPPELLEEMRESSNEIAAIDERMQEIYRKIQLID